MLTEVRIKRPEECVAAALNSRREVNFLERDLEQYKKKRTRILKAKNRCKAASPEFCLVGVGLGFVLSPFIATELMFAANKLNTIDPVTKGDIAKTGFLCLFIAVCLGTALGYAGISLAKGMIKWYNKRLFAIREEMDTIDQEIEVYMSQAEGYSELADKLRRNQVNIDVTDVL